MRRLGLKDLKLLAILGQAVDGADGLAHLTLLLLYCVEPGVRVFLHLKFRQEISFDGLMGHFLPPGYQPKGYQRTEY